MAFLKRPALLLAALIALAGTSCFSAKQPGCAFSCAEDGVCPTGYSCQADGVCHRDDGQGTCDIPSQVDAGQDGVSADGDAASGDGP
ncbi:MAG TPA: hypothetical protein VKQ32_16330 [Polyangia bacterium]|nr:hypothetical protein [Polyangia bacterium]